MKRLSEDDAPEMYPATVNEWASPLRGDSTEVAIIRPLLKRTQLEERALRKAYDSEIHGWSAAAFHECVDSFGAGLLVAESKGGAILGGYNPRGWIGIGEDRDSIAAFLFSWSDGDVSQLPVKLRKVGGPSLAVVDKEGVGPQFGAEGLTISMAPGLERKAKSRLGTYYERMPSGARHIFASDEGSKSGGTTDLLWMKVFVAQGKGEEWELDGIVWKTKT